MKKTPKSAALPAAASLSDRRNLLGLRAKDEERALLDQAAAKERRSRQNFVLFYSLAAARRTLGLTSETAA